MAANETSFCEETSACCGFEVKGSNIKKEISIPVLFEEEGFLPAYSSDLAAGADVRACIKEDIHLDPGASILIPTGLRFAIPEGYEIQVRPRSGLALKNQITVLNTPGTIDADYRGEVGVILINHGKNTFVITPGMRIAQIVLSPVYRAAFVKEGDLSITSRGEGGFGHTGTN
jgi:dUTP pyrophosphatase